MKEGGTAVGSGAQVLNMAHSLDAQTVETTFETDGLEVEMAFGTEVADAKGSSIGRAVKEVPIALGAGVQ